MYGKISFPLVVTSDIHLAEDKKSCKCIEAFGYPGIKGGNILLERDTTQRVET